MASDCQNLTVLNYRVSFLSRKGKSSIHLNASPAKNNLSIIFSSCEFLPAHRNNCIIRTPQFISVFLIMSPFSLVHEY
jgi:hypothetical protein